MASLLSACAARTGRAPVLRPSWLRGRSRGWLARRGVVVAWDAAGWVLALVTATGLHRDFDFSTVLTPALGAVTAVAIGGQLAVGAVLRTYAGRYPVGSVDEAVNVAATTALAGVIACVYALAAHAQLAGRSVPLLALPIAVLVTVGARLGFRLRHDRRRRGDYGRARRVIVLGAGSEGQQLLRSMLTDPDARYLPVAFLDDDEALRRFRTSGVEVRGTRADVASTAATERADMLVIADRSLSVDAVLEVATTAQDAGLAVSLLATLDELLKPVPAGPVVPAPRAPADDAVAPTRSPALSRAKRALDVVGAVAAGLVVLPVAVLVAVVLRATSGQVVYRASRVGREGEPFTMYKFVTMARDGDGPRITRKDDLRVTRVGRWLRRTKLNELPQILNVIKGDMSLVGPRPEDPRYASHYLPRHRPVLAARPGMTSLAFLHFGDEEAFLARVGPRDVEEFYLGTLLPEKLDIELDYVRTWSLRKDLMILGATARMLLSRAH